MRASIVLLLLTACEPSTPATSGPYDVQNVLKMLVDATRDLQGRMDKLEERNRHLAICLDGAFDMQTVHNCAHHWRYEEKGWE